ncbi:MAG: hypothetical protein K0R15_2155 [Clostridiales bacterium]|jgi:hypothetical protein|nr:hypothetical protein [Clostridiales bacterium]
MLQLTNKPNKNIQYDDIVNISIYEILCEMKNSFVSS